MSRFEICPLSQNPRLVKSEPMLSVKSINRRLGYTEPLVQIPNLHITFISLCLCLDYRHISESQLPLFTALLNSSTHPPTPSKSPHSSSHFFLRRPILQLRSIVAGESSDTVAETTVHPGFVVLGSFTVMSGEERPSTLVVDPLLKDLSEKKQNFRRNVVSLAAELKEVRSRLAYQEQSFVRETLTRQEAESKAKKMEEEINKLQESLEEKNGELQFSALNTEKYVKQLDDLKSQLSATQATADASAASAESAQLQCLVLLKELDEKNSSLKEHEVRVNKLGEQLDLLQKDLQARESSQRQLKDEVVRIEHDIMQALAKSGANTDCELRKVLDEVSPKNIEKMNKLLTDKDEELAKLRYEIRIMSAHWKLKTKELESQLEKHRRADQELKKRIMKLEFCLQETRSQTRKLQRMGERRDKAIKELRDQLSVKQVGTSSNNNQNFWDTSGFKVVVSMSMLMLVLFSKR